jgi:Serine carboxypeptidase
VAGNGWVDPTIQGPATIDYSWWHGLIDQPTRDSLHNEWENCYHGHNPGGGPFHSLNVQDDCGIMWGILLAAGNPNAYDITTWDPNVDQVTFTSEAFYNRDDVKQMLHAPDGITWHGCRWGAGRRRHRALSLSGATTSLGDRQRKLYMDNDRPWSVMPYVADLVDHGIPVLMYNGDRDMTTNMVGTELAINQMDWSGKKEWLDAPRGVWKVDDAVAGWAKEWGSLKFVVVYNSGHMVSGSSGGFFS